MVIILGPQIDEAPLVARVGGDTVDAMADGDGDEDVEDGGAGVPEGVEGKRDDEDGGGELVGKVLGEDVVVVCEPASRVSLLASGS